MTVPFVRSVYDGSEGKGKGESRPWTVVYDGNCKVCNRLVRVLTRWDRRNIIESVPYQNAHVAARFPWIPLEEYQLAMQLIGPGGRTWQGAQAVEQLLSILPSGRLFAWVLRLPLAGRLLDRFYRWFARNRYRFGCGDHCQLRPASVNDGDS